MQAWQVPHPPARGSHFCGGRPAVHQGFLKSWVANGLNQRIVARVEDIVTSHEWACTKVPCPLHHAFPVQWHPGAAHKQHVVRLTGSKIFLLREQMLVMCNCAVDGCFRKSLPSFILTDAKLPEILKMFRDHCHGLHRCM